MLQIQILVYFPKILITQSETLFDLSYVYSSVSIVKNANNSE